MIFKLKNINNIQNFGNNLHSLQKKQSIAPSNRGISLILTTLAPKKTIYRSYGAQKNLHKIFLQTFCSYGTIFPEVKLLKNFKQTLSTLWQTWKTSCYKNFTKNFALLRKTNSVNLQIS